LSTPATANKVRALQIAPHIARRGEPRRAGLGICWWVVDGNLALRTGFASSASAGSRDDIHRTFITLGCASSVGDD